MKVVSVNQEQLSDEMGEQSISDFEFNHCVAW